MPNEAIALFDQCDPRGSSQFVNAFQRNGWYFVPASENSALMVKDGEDAVVKIFDPSGIQDGYHAFATELAKEPDVIGRYRHLPVIHRYRPGVAVVERLAVVDADWLEEWRYEAMVLGTRLRINEDLSPRCDDFFAENPMLVECVRFLEKVHAMGRFRYSIKGEDILQRPDGTPVMFDPIL